jgi:type I restriction enzyme, S subunit
VIEIVPTLGRWPRVPLGDLCDIRGGFPAPQDDAAFEDGEIPFVRMKDVGRHHFTNNLCETDQSLNRAHFEKGRYQLTPRGSILIPRSGSVGLNHRAILTVDAVIVSHLCALVPTSKKVTTEFLYRFLCLADMRKLTKKTTGLDSIAFSDLRMVAIPLPPLAEQRQIAGVLDRAEALRAKRRSAFAQLDSLARSLFLDLFGDPATNPKGWPRKSICEIGKVITGNTPPRVNPDYYGSAIEWIKSDNINTPHYYLTKADEGLSELGKAVARTVPAGSILVTCIAGSPECIGNAAMTDREVAFNQQINAFVPVTGDAHFLYAQMIVGKRLIQEASTAGMKGMVSKGRFEQIMLVLPPIELQREFAQRVGAVEKLKAAQRASLAELDALFATLEHRAFQGDL